jgi:hypothetical protein
MPEHQLRSRLFCHAANHLVRPHPIVVIPRQPALRHRVPEVLLNVVLIACEDPRPGFPQVDLHNAQAGRVAWGVV